MYTLKQIHSSRMPWIRSKDMHRNIVGGRIHCCGLRYQDHCKSTSCEAGWKRQAEAPCTDPSVSRTPTAGMFWQLGATWCVCVGVGGGDTKNRRSSQMQLNGHMTSGRQSYMEMFYQSGQLSHYLFTRLSAKAVTQSNWNGLHFSSV